MYILTSSDYVLVVRITQIGNWQFYEKMPTHSFVVSGQAIFGLASFC